MKKFLILIVVLVGFSLNSTAQVPKNHFKEGFKTGWCEGYKYERGRYSVCPVAPVPPVPKSTRENDYKSGYNEGFSRGAAKGREDKNKYDKKIR